MTAATDLPVYWEITQDDIDRADRARAALERITKRVPRKADDKRDGKACRQAALMLLGRS